jgi:hypothetical protein
MKIPATMCKEAPVRVWFGGLVVAAIIGLSSCFLPNLLGSESHRGQNETRTGHSARMFKNRKEKISSPDQSSASPESQRQTRAKVLSLRLAPQNLTLWGAKASQRLLLLAKYSDGLERDATLQSRFSISDERVARVESERRRRQKRGPSALQEKSEGSLPGKDVTVVIVMAA